MTHFRNNVAMVLELKVLSDMLAKTYQSTYDELTYLCWSKCMYITLDKLVLPLKMHLVHMTYADGQAIKKEREHGYQPALYFEPACALTSLEGMEPFSR